MPGPYPRPGLVRESWMSLDGEWDFGVGSETQPTDPFIPLDRKINLPFCPESELSGINEKGFMKTVFYRRRFALAPDFAGKRVILHFGAVDHYARVYINGSFAGEHAGGYTPFCFDITGLLREGENEIFVRADDDVRSPRQPSGKQSDREGSYGCFYTRVTGIWQTVWLEAANEKRVQSYRVYPCVAAPGVTLRFYTTAAADGAEIAAETTYLGAFTGDASGTVSGGEAELYIPLSEKHLWEPGAGRLYDFKAKLTVNGAVCDEFSGYFGLREVGLNEKGMTVNGESFFGRYVLDQGYYPQGVYTAPSDEALKNDIECAMKLGFNGARLHQKVFEPRFLYWADRLGYAVWGEYPSWGLDVTDESALNDFLPGWMEAVERDFSHPSIIGWCPFNETWDRGDRRQCDSVLEKVYSATKLADPTRPVIDTSGNYHVVTDIFDVHDYEQDPAKFKTYYSRIGEGVLLDQIERATPGRQKYPGGPVFMSEYGGIKSSVGGSGWGYGESVADDTAFIARLKGLTDVLLDNPHIFAFCYTQLYDVEQEQNGLMTYDRRFKFDPEIIRSIIGRERDCE